MPEVIHRTNAGAFVRRWLFLNKGMENPSISHCYCGQYQLMFDDKECTNPNHYAYKLDHRCGSHTVRKRSDGTFHLCRYADRHASHIIPDYVIEGLCSSCPHSQREYQDDLIKQQRKRQNEECEQKQEGLKEQIWDIGALEQVRNEQEQLKKERLEQEQLELFREARERHEAINR